MIWLYVESLKKSQAHRYRVQIADIPPEVGRWEWTK